MKGSATWMSFWGLKHRGPEGIRICKKLVNNPSYFRQCVASTTG